MLLNECHEQILSHLEHRHTVSVQELATVLYASTSTIRRDLGALETRGLLKRVHGGAVILTGNTVDTPAYLHQTDRLEEKRRIAFLGRRFLKNSASYFFDSSSTAACLAGYLENSLNVRLATNGFEILTKLTSTDNLSGLSCGGFFRSPYDEFTGNIALRSIALLCADIFFFSCAGFSLEQGATEISDENIVVKRAFYQKARKHILLCDHTKFGKDFFYNSFRIEELDYIVTDRIPQDNRYLEVLGAKLIY